MSVSDIGIGIIKSKIIKLAYFLKIEMEGWFREGF
jgi:hypothetical protein